MNNQRELSNAQIVLEDRVITSGYVRVSNGRISEIGEGNPPKESSLQRYDLQGKFLFPGFIDLHVHGGGGGSFMSQNSAEHLVARNFHLSHGTTSLLATTTTTDLDKLATIINSLTDSSKLSDAGSKVLGIHTEGPFISKQKPGAHPISAIRDASVADMVKLIDASSDFIRMVTIAPEIEGGYELISFLKNRGIVVSVGHTDATYEEIMDAIELGASSTTHTFNAMRGLSHREPGTVGAILDSEKVFAEAILDGIHIHPAAFRIILAAKTPNRINLVTDATALAGQPDGLYPRGVGGESQKLGEKITIAGTETLAGSGLNMNTAFKNCRKYSEMSFPNLSLVASLNAAKILGMESDLGSIQVGKIADMVSLNTELEVDAVMVDGDWKYLTSRSLFEE